ncbi:hypothetical protein BDW72DRAFT_13530 [Aspergillus terricola var. indicus]
MFSSPSYDVTNLADICRAALLNQLASPSFGRPIPPAAVCFTIVYLFFGYKRILFLISYDCCLGSITVARMGIGALWSLKYRYRRFHPFYAMPCYVDPTALLLVSRLARCEVENRRF